MIGPPDILNGKILIVDDKEANIILLERMLRGVVTSTRKLNLTVINKLIF